MPNNHCSPHIKTVSGCFSREALVNIANNINNSGGSIAIGSKNKDELVKEINKSMNKQCKKDDEICWANATNNHNLVDEYYKPKRPEKKHQWLSSTDISKVMKQYMKKYKDFMFFGPLPRDFADINTEISKQNLHKLQLRGINYVGIIFNMDKHNQPGSHWVAYFIDLKRDLSVEYFDSVAVKPPKEINAFMDKVIANAKKNLKLNLKKKINNIQHQKKNSECGVYSLHFIIERLAGRTFEEVIQDVISDSDMNEFRNEYFRK